MLELIAGLGWVAAGSALGGAGRFLVSGVVTRAIGRAFPWGTMTVNVTGSLALGALAGRAQAGGIDPALWQLAGIGFLGSYTTVSAFSAETLALARAGAPVRAAGNVALSLALCVGAAAAGFVAAGFVGAGFVSAGFVAAG